MNLKLLVKILQQESFAVGRKSIKKNNSNTVLIGRLIELNPFIDDESIISVVERL